MCDSGLTVRCVGAGLDASKLSAVATEIASLELAMRHAITGERAFETRTPSLDTPQPLGSALEKAFAAAADMAHEVRTPVCSSSDPMDTYICMHSAPHRSMCLPIDPLVASYP